MKKSNLEIVAIRKALEARYNGIINFPLETDWEAIDKHVAERAIFTAEVRASGTMTAERARTTGTALIEASYIIDVLNGQEWRIRYNKKIDRDELAIYQKMLTKRVAADVPVMDVIAMIPNM